MAVAPAHSSSEPLDQDALTLGGVSARRALVLLAAGVAFLLSTVLLAPALAGLGDVWDRLADGDLRWLALALGFEALSFVGHIVLFSAVAQDGGSRIGLWASTQINLAGHAATRLFASAGAGG